MPFPRPSGPSSAARRRAATAAALLAVAATPAAAVTLADSVFTEYLIAGNTYGAGYVFNVRGADPNLPEAFTASNSVADASGSGLVRTLGGSLPRAEGALTFTQLATTQRVLYAAFEARVYYEWAVEQVGGDPYSGTVPIAVRTRGAIDSQIAGPAGTAKPYDLWAHARIDLLPRGSDERYHAVQGCRAGTCTLGPMAFDDGFVGDAVLGEVYAVELVAHGSGNVVAEGGSFTLSAWVDPVFEIDPSFARREDFRLVFGAGVVPVPEPATQALMLLGLVLVAGAAGARRRTPP